MRVVLCALLLAVNLLGSGAVRAAEPATAPAPAPAAATAVTPVQTVDLAATATTYTKADIAQAGEVAFGRASPEMNKILAKVFDEMGEPSAYIDGRQAGGAFIFGASYGSGKLFHKVEGQQPVFWTGPSFGLDVGADAGVHADLPPPRYQRHVPALRCRYRSCLCRRRVERAISGA
jgi:hypothetical protein